jgi:hypothetical protein
VGDIDRRGGCGYVALAADSPTMRSVMDNGQGDRRSRASMKSLFDEVLT